MLGVPWVALCVVLRGMLCVGLAVAAPKRARVEDEALRRAFGEEWEAWARRTPYSLIPYVY